MEANLKEFKYHLTGNLPEVICECFSGKGGYYFLSGRHKVKIEHPKDPGTLGLILQCMHSGVYI